MNKMKMNKPALMLTVNSHDFTLKSFGKKDDSGVRYLVRSKIEPAEKEEHSDRLFVCAKNATNKVYCNDVIGECRIEETIDGTPDEIREHVKKINVDRGTERQDLTLFRIEHNRYNVVRLYKVTDLHPYSLPNADWRCWGLKCKPKTAKLIMPENQPFLYKVKRGCFTTDIILYHGRAVWYTESREATLEGFIPMWYFSDNEAFIDDIGRSAILFSIENHLKYGTFWRYEDGGYKRISKKCLEDMFAAEERETEIALKEDEEYMQSFDWESLDLESLM